jgi:hypothetical protein
MLGKPQIEAVAAVRISVNGNLAEGIREQDAEEDFWTGGRRNLLNEELPNLYSSPGTVVGRVV